MVRYGTFRLLPRKKGRDGRFDRRFHGSLVQPSLGRPLSGGQPNTTVNLIAPGSLYGDRANELDLRLTKPIRLARLRISVNADVYNLFNVSPVMQFNAVYAAWLTPQRIMDGRLYKLSGQISF